MLSIIKSLALRGLDGFLVDVQVDISSGLPEWNIVGLPDTSVKESKERVRTAIKNSGFELLSRKVTVNLAPADIKKEGSIYDLPIAIGILMSLNIIQKNMEDTVMIGELSLNGNLNPINGALPLCIEAKKLGIKRIILPYDNAKEVSIIEGIEILSAHDLLEVVNFLNRKHSLEKFTTNWQDILLKYYQKSLDFCDVKGQESAKRAIEIAVAGGHNCLLIR